MPVDEKQEGKRQAASKGIGYGTMLFLAILAVGGLWMVKPELFRLRGIQVPVGVTIRNSYVGVGNVVRVRNTSNKTLIGMEVTARNSASNQTATYRIMALPAGETAEIGWMEWNWKVEPGETIKVSADDYWPIIFSSEQLGVK